jgi:deoxyribonuclease V
VWPRDAQSLIARQTELGRQQGPRPVMVDPGSAAVAACWVCLPLGLTGPGTGHDPVWCATVVTRGGKVLEQRTADGIAGAPYVAGLMALRLGPLMDDAVRSLHLRPDVVMIDATAGDHPRHAGLALHLGSELDIASIGITHRPLVARGEWPEDSRGATSPLRFQAGTAAPPAPVVGCWLRTRAGTRPLAVHPGWRMDLATAVEVVMSMTGSHRTPEPLRRARELARRARAEARARR